jgi:hypothetical protein
VIVSDGYLHTLRRLRMGMQGASGPALGRPARLRLRCSWDALQPVDGKPPRMPEGFKTDVDKNGWRH